MRYDFWNTGEHPITGYKKIKDYQDYNKREKEKRKKLNQKTEY